MKTLIKQVNLIENNKQMLKNIKIVNVKITGLFDLEEVID